MVLTIVGLFVLFLNMYNYITTSI